ncbi:MAG: hypothetical protein RMJ98_19190 [Myxococcales bacterium]|nr:hypothetical protein [Myxococcales bacterium]
MAHQEEDPRNLLIVVVGLGSVITIVGTLFGLYSYYATIRNNLHHERVQTIEDPRLKELRAREARILTTYAYTNAEKTQVRIPVDRAMKLLAQRGRDAIPSIQPTPPPVASAPTPPPAPQDEKKDDKKDEKKDDKKDKRDNP